ncbi:hypothetical protein SapgrDRAFT_2115 [Saprospira grandis DSM 2844]|uniref:Uncharacterized protein n=1 Tax=Saprospira grandis DSM 2844 TaxID=694433 RepID=J0P1Z1_9BACT|nr:hypothetical protein SapgrDRAFT_2115 [Saprospira grandis DSM 2844]
MSKAPSLIAYFALLPAVLRGLFLGAAPPFGRVGPLRSSQVCSALRRQSRLGLPPSAALLQPLSLRRLRRLQNRLEVVLLLHLLLKEQSPKREFGALNS